MERILIQINNKEKAKMLLELLESLDFVEFIEAKVEADLDTKEILHTKQADFFAMAGLWEGRNITLESIRRQAWPRQHHGSL